VYDVTSVRDLRYATADGADLFLDLHLPSAPDAPLVVYAHGGGFTLGDKADGEKERLVQLARRGVAVASINYRLATQALFPAQVDDMRAAVRWLRGHGDEHGLRTDRVGVWGASAGGYLATMTALSSDDDESAVQAAVIWFAPSDLASSARRSPLERQILFPPFELTVLGGDTTPDADLVQRSSALAHVTPSAPPFLIAHGDSDRIVPPSESKALHDALARAGVPSTLTCVAGAGHEDPAFDRPETHALTAAWLRSILLREAAA
jgi:acetyl esterase/lipase